MATVSNLAALHSTPPRWLCSKTELFSKLWGCTLKVGDLALLKDDPQATSYYRASLTSQLVTPYFIIYYPTLFFTNRRNFKTRHRNFKESFTQLQMSRSELCHLAPYQLKNSNFSVLKLFVEALQILCQPAQRTLYCAVASRGVSCHGQGDANASCRI